MLAWAAGQEAGQANGMLNMLYQVYNSNRDTRRCRWSWKPAEWMVLREASIRHLDCNWSLGMRRDAKNPRRARASALAALDTALSLGWQRRGRSTKRPPRAACDHHRFQAGNPSQDMRHCEAHVSGGC